MVVLADKRKNPYGMQLLQSEKKIIVNKSHEVNVEPWVTIGELAHRIVAARMVEESSGLNHTETQYRYSREYIGMCLDLIGSTVVSCDYEFFDVVDFDIKS